MLRGALLCVEIDLNLNIGLNQMVVFYGLDTNETYFFYATGYDTNGVETTNNWKLTMKPLR